MEQLSDEQRQFFEIMVSRYGWLNVVPPFTLLDAMMLSEKRFTPGERQRLHVILKSILDDKRKHIEAQRQHDELVNGRLE